MAENGRVRLDSWKQIAAHFGRDVRTVARWEKERGLPVHHVPGGRGRRVFAYVDELDQWLEGEREAAEETAKRDPVIESNPVIESTPPRVRRPFAVAGVAGLVLALAWTAWVVTASPLPLQSLTLRGRDLVARTTAGTDAWAFTAPFTPGLPPATLGWYDFGEFDGTNGVDVAATLLGSWDAADVLYALSNRGERLWTQILDGHVILGSTRYGPPWRGLAVDVFEVDGAPRIAWTTHHHTAWPSMLTLHDRDGREIDRFVHQGWLASVRATADGRYLLAAGSANAYGGYALAVLDPRNPGGSPPTPSDPEFHCGDCPSGRPLRYFVLGRSELAERSDLPLFHSRVPMRIQLLSDGNIELRVREGDGASEAIYEFSSDVSLRRASVSDAYWTWHRELGQAGLIDHSSERCPDRDGLSVREWTPATGWRD